MKEIVCRWLCYLTGCLLAACVLEMPQVAVIDRIVEGEDAVLIVGDPPELELIVPMTELPAGAREGDWLEVEVEDGRLASARIDYEATERARKRVKSRLDALRERGRRLE